MTALAVIAGLVAAMFVALQSVSAAGACAESGGVITLGFSQTCTVAHADAEGTPDVTGVEPAGGVTAALADGVVTITAGTAPTTTSATVTVHDDGADGTPDNDDDVTLATYTVNVAGLGIAKTEIVGDRDNVISAGPQITARVTVRSPADAAEVRVTVPTTGLSLQSTATGTTGETTQSITTALATIADTTAPNTDATDGVVVADFVVNTAGAPDGDYVITFTVDNDAFTANDVVEEGERVTGTLTITIGDPGMGIGSASLSLGNSEDDVPYTADNEAVAEDGSEPANNGDINLVVEVFDSNGDKANNGSINQLIVIAPGGRITTTHNTGAGAADDPTKAMGSSSVTLNEVDADDAGTAEAGDVGQRTVITIAKADKKPGTVTVYAIVSGPGGAARTGDITLTFSGPATSMTVHDATESLLSVNPVGDDPATANTVETDHETKDTIKLQVTAEDVSGNSATPPTGGVTIEITDPDGKRVNRDKIDFTQPTPDGAKHFITLTGQGKAATPLKAGNYTLKATQGKLSSTATFAVAGAANDVAVTASQTSSDTIGDVITVTATVTDKDGNTVSDGTMVMFDVSDDTGLAAIGTGHSGKATKDGVAKVKFAVVGAGNSVVSATAGDATGVVVIVSTAGMAAAEDAEPVDCGLAGLNRLSGFASWDCDADTTASALFSLLSSRDVTAIHLWNGSSWVRYSVVDGSEVPGSSDFTVTDGDNLYISN